MPLLFLILILLGQVSQTFATNHGKDLFRAVTTVDQGIHALDIRSEMISFVYSPAEFPEASCTHKPLAHLTHNWLVHCEDGNFKRDFVVHLLVRQYRKLESPKSKLEILYWVTNRIVDPPKPEFVGSTIWLYFTNIAELDSFLIGQSVDNDYAHLNLEFKTFQ